MGNFSNGSVNLFNLPGRKFAALPEFEVLLHPSAWKQHHSLAVHQEGFNKIIRFQAHVWGNICLQVKIECIRWSDIDAAQNACRVFAPMRSVKVLVQTCELYHQVKYSALKLWDYRILVSELTLNK